MFDARLFSSILQTRLRGGNRTTCIDICADADVMSRLGMTHVFDHFPNHTITRFSLDHGIRELTTGHDVFVRKRIRLWCRNRVNMDYVIDEIDASNLILILRDSDRRPRGFALLVVGSRSMEVLVLCTAPLPDVPSRDKVYARGGSLLRYIQYLGHQLEGGIGLRALARVISLYHHFGWQPRQSCRAKVRHDLAGEIEALKKYFQSNSSNVLPPHLRSRFRYFMTGRTQRQIQGKTPAEADAGAEEHGIRMWLCRDRNPYSSAAAAARPTIDGLQDRPPLPGVFVKSKGNRPSPATASAAAAADDDAQPPTHGYSKKREKRKLAVDATTAAAAADAQPSTHDSGAPPYKRRKL